MTQDGTGLDNPQGKTVPEGTTGETGPDSPNPDQDQMTLEKALTEIRELRRLKGKLTLEAQTNREAQQKAIRDLEEFREQQLKKQGEYKELYEAEVAKTTDLAVKATKAERLEAAVKAANEQRIEQIPAAIREDIVPNLPPEELSAWLDKALPKLTAAPIPRLDGGAGGVPNNKPPSNVSEKDKQIAAIAAKHGVPVDPNRIAEHREKHGK